MRCAGQDRFCAASVWPLPCRWLWRCGHKRLRRSRTRCAPPASPTHTATAGIRRARRIVRLAISTSIRDGRHAWRSARQRSTSARPQPSLPVVGRKPAAERSPVHPHHSGRTRSGRTEPGRVISAPPSERPRTAAPVRPPPYGRPMRPPPCGRPHAAAPCGRPRPAAPCGRPMRPPHAAAPGRPPHAAAPVRPPHAAAHLRTTPQGPPVLARHLAAWTHDNRVARRPPIPGAWTGRPFQRAACP